MAEPFLSEIRIFSFQFAPKGWALCNGQLLPINQNQALFSLLGTTYGGDGRVNFALPDLRDRTPIHVGNGHTLGERAGEESHTLSIAEMPAHSHLARCNSGIGDKPAPAANFWASTTANPYSSNAPNGSMNPLAVTTVGGSQAHLNLSPFLTISFCIALQGIFPSPN
jgi:microcystin-dependent protein